MNESLSSLIDAASREAARLHRQGVPRSQAIRAAAQAVRRCVPLPSRRLAVGVGQDESHPAEHICAASPDLPTAILVGAGALAMSSGRWELGAFVSGVGWVYHLLKG